MSEYIAWYLVELRIRLAPHLSSARVETIVRETDCHLRETAERLQGQLAISEERAVLTAIDSFGSPERVALTHLRESAKTVLGVKLLFWVIGCGLLAILCWDFHWMSLSGPFDNKGETGQNELAGIIGAIALVGFTVGCRIGRQSFRKPLLASAMTMLAAMTLFSCYWVVPTDNGYRGVFRPDLRRAQRDIPVSMAGLDQYLTFLDRGEKQFAVAKTSADITPEFANIGIAEKALQIPEGTSIRAFPEIGTGTTAFATPTQNVFASAEGGNYYGLKEEPTFEAAKGAWLKDAGLAKMAANSERDQMNRLLSRVNEAKSGRLMFSNAFVVSNLTCWTLIFLPGLLFIDWLSFTLVRRKRAWPVRSLA